jgi:O-acetylhomoserine/O-acetylserine sulfhydrylase-like pyridoxal-dependent enzyme
MTHLGLRGLSLAVTPQLIRLAESIENVDDLLSDLAQALERA